jgi:hypothetical protein
VAIEMPGQRTAGGDGQRALPAAIDGALQAAGRGDGENIVQAGGADQIGETFEFRRPDRARALAVNGPVGVGRGALQRVGAAADQMIDAGKGHLDRAIDMARAIAIELPVG